MDHSQTALVPYSIGTAAVNKPLDSRDLQITLGEVMGFLDGALEDNTDDIEITTLDKDGETHIHQSTASNVVTATWLPFGTNRMTPPDIRKGERIMVYRMRNTERYFWSEMGLDDELRKLETVIYAYSANPDISVHEQSIENCYFLEISAHNKVTTFSTSQANGEVTRFLVQFNGAEGTMTVKDAHGQEIFTSAMDEVIRAVNGTGTEVILDKADCRVNAPAKVQIKAGSDVGIDAGGNVAVRAGGTAVIDGGGSVLTLTGGGTTLDTPKFSGCN